MALPGCTEYESSREHATPSLSLSSTSALTTGEKYLAESDYRLRKPGLSVRLPGTHSVMISFFSAVMVCHDKFINMCYTLKDIKSKGVREGLSPYSGHLGP